MRVLVVGTGSIGRRHIDVLKADKEHDIIICEVDKSNADEAGEKHGISEVYYNIEDALEANIDAAIICTPNAYHAQATIAALEAGADVLVEKPIASNIEDAWRMVMAQERTGRTLMVGYTLRVYSGLHEVKRIIDSGKMGRPISARVNLSAAITLELNKSDYRKSYETGGGIIYDYSHEIDYLRFLFGELRRYACFADIQVKKELTCDDVAEIILQYKSGVLASLHMDYVLDGGRKLVIICENGAISYDFMGNLGLSPKIGAHQSIHFNASRNEMFSKQFKIFQRACRGDKVDYVTGADGLKILQICEGLYESNRKNIVGQF